MRLASHPGVLATRASIQETQGERLSTISPASPMLSAEYQGITSGGSLSDYGERRIAVSQELDFPLKYIWRASATEAAVAEASGNATARILDLEFGIRLAYSELWVIDQNCRVLTEIVERVHRRSIFYVMELSVASCKRTDQDRST